MTFGRSWLRVSEYSQPPKRKRRRTKTIMNKICTRCRKDFDFDYQSWKAGYGITQFGITIKIEHKHSVFDLCDACVVKDLQEVVISLIRYLIFLFRI